FSGSIDGRDGGFTLVHQGSMSQNESSLDIKILEGSGQGQLSGISGTMKITQNNDTHKYELEYKLK
ncbi:MAG: DUF3224 domain-containing protein, partial [Pseudomonadota bacterium]